MDNYLKIRSATTADCEAVQALVFGVLKEYDLALDPDGIDMAIAEIELNYLARGDVFEVIENPDGEIVGACGLYP